MTQTTHFADSHSSLRIPKALVISTTCASVWLASCPDRRSDYRLAVAVGRVAGCENYPHLPQLHTESREVLWSILPSPSMRRPVSVKSVFLSSLWGFCVWAEPPLSPSFHPHSLVERFSLGASWASSFQQVLLPDNRPRLPSLRRELGQDLGAVT
jgi:hypothetical protein